MKITELLLEIVDHPYPWKWISSNEITTIVEFMDGDDVINVYTQNLNNYAYTG
jgi:hypothetical protein